MLNKVLVRLKNKKVLALVLSGILVVLVNLGIIDIETSNKAEELLGTVLGILVAVGAITDPESHIKE